MCAWSAYPACNATSANGISDASAFNALRARAKSSQKEGGSPVLPVIQRCSVRSVTPRDFAAFETVELAVIASISSSLASA